MRNSLAVGVSVFAIVVGGSTGCSGTTPAPHADSSTAVAPSHESTAVASPEAQGRSPASYFKVGDCIRDPITGATSVTLVDCAKPHAGEVYAIFMLPEGPFPGNDSVAGYKKQCGEVARTILSAEEAANDPSLTTKVRSPDEKSWAMGDRSVTCIAATDQPRTGSIRDKKN